MNEDMEVDDTVEKSGKKLLLILIAICVLGVIMVFSSSYMYAKETYDNSLHYFLRQLTYTSLGSIGAFVVYKTKYTFWIKYSYFVHITATLVLASTLIPNIGLEAKGASRWIGLFGQSFQPSELVKFTTILASIHYFDHFMEMTKAKRIQRSLYLIFPLGILLFQPDFGSFTILVLVMAFTCFMSSFPRKIFYASVPVGVLILGGLLLTQPYRVRRLFAFLNPWENPRGSGFQIIQSLFGFANGSWFGQGLGNSNEKLFYLPEAHNDFIFSVLGEELGFLGVFVTALLFIAFVYFGFRASAHIQQRQGALLATLIIFLIGLQAFLNMGVVLGLLPTKGLNLPFISYGGSSMVSNLFGIGLFFSALRQDLFSSLSSNTSFEATREFESFSGMRSQRRPSGL